MATINPVVTPPQFHKDDIHIISWPTMTFSGSDVGAPIQMAGSNDRSIQVHGTFGAAGNMKIEGSNDGVTYYTLSDPQGNALDFTTAKIEQVMEITRFIRPRVTAGDGTTSLTVTMCLRRPY